MTQPQQPQEPTLGDMIIEDLENQLGEGDPRYGKKCRDLAVVRSQYRQLLEFVKSKADILGLTEVDDAGVPLAEAEPEEPAAEKVDAPKKGNDQPATSSPHAPVNGAKVVSKEARNP